MNNNVKMFIFGLVLAVPFQVWWMTMDGFFHWQAIPAQIGFGICGYNYNEVIIWWRHARG